MPKEDNEKQDQVDHTVGQTESALYLSPDNTATVGAIVAAAVRSTANYDVRDTICHKATVELFTALLKASDKATISAG